MDLKSCIKIGYGRCVKPEDTIRRLEAAIGQQYDYWMREEKVSDSLYWTAMFIDALEFRSMGKGVSAVLSKAGALAEGAEWLMALDVERLPGYLTGHQDEVENALKIEELLLHVVSLTSSDLATIKNLDQAQHWVDGYSLRDGRAMKVPIEYVRCITGPNGKAAGNRIEEAIVHATNEVFERRAHITVLKNRMVVPTIDLDTIRHPVIREQLDFVRGKGIEVYLKDLSFGGVLPCVGAYFLDPNIPGEYQFHHFFKVGASFTGEDSLIRTFTEYAQGRRLDEFIAGDRSDQERVLKHDFRALRSQGNECDNFLSSFMFGFVPYADADFLKEGELVAFDEGECFEDCLDDIARAREICEELGRDYIVVDFTNPVIGFPVVQVIIPSYSDVLPFHPDTSPALFKQLTRSDVLRSYGHAGV